MFRLSGSRKKHVRANGIQGICYVYLNDDSPMRLSNKVSSSYVKPGTHFQQIIVEHPAIL